MGSKAFSYLFLFFLSISIAYGLENCQGAVFDTEDIPCLLILPVETGTDCTSITITIYNENESLYSSSLESYSPVMCSTTFNESTVGTYTGSYSTGDTAKWRVTEGYKLVYLIFGLLILAILLTFIAIWKEDVNVAALAGFIFLGVGTYIFINGFSIYSNLLTDIMAIVSIGIGSYLLGKFMEIQFNF